MSDGVDFNLHNEGLLQVTVIAGVTSLISTHAIYPNVVSFIYTV